MQVDLLNGMAYEGGTFNLQGGTDKRNGELKLQEDIKFLLTQEKGKFYPDPEFGSELQNEIKDLIEKYYPQLNLIGIDVDLIPENKSINVTIRYNYSDGSQDASTINLTLFNKIDN